jgi:hypothetical protein
VIRRREDGNVFALFPYILQVKRLVRLKQLQSDELCISANQFLYRKRHDWRQIELSSCLSTFIRKFSVLSAGTGRLTDRVCDKVVHAPRI